MMNPGITEKPVLLHDETDQKKESSTGGDLVQSIVRSQHPNSANRRLACSQFPSRRSVSGCS